MNIKNITLVGLLIIFLSSCYSDKGNYDYIEINDFEINLNPTPPETSVYMVNQPSGDTLLFTIKAEVSQTISQTDSNLEYFWTSTIGNKTDSIYSSDITLRIPPDKNSTFNLMCRVRDKELDIEYYEFVSVKTEVPFHDSWLLFHGEMGDRKIGAIQWDVAGNSRWDTDIMLASNRRQLKNATDIAYSPSGTSIPGDWLRTERLLITIDSDTVLNFLPFDVKPSDRRPWSVSRPVNKPNLKIARIQPHGKSEYAGMVDEDGKFYWVRAEDFFYSALSDNVPNYQVDHFYTNDAAVATLWDNNAKRFMFYKMGSNDYNRWNGDNRQDNANTTQIVYCEDVQADEMQNKTVLWAGKGAKAVDNRVESSLFVVKDEITNTCYLYDFAYDDEKEKSKMAIFASTDLSPEYDLMQLKRDTLSNISFEDDAVFATSNAFNEQLFFTENNELYRFIIATEEVVPLLSFDGKVKLMRFRISENYGIPDETFTNLRTIGIVIEGKNGRDLFKEVYLDNAGDIIKVVDYDYDYGKIKKIDYTVTQRRFDV